MLVGLIGLLTARHHVPTSTPAIMLGHLSCRSLAECTSSGLDTLQA